MDSLKGMFGQPEWSLRHEAIKYLYTKRMKEGTSVREHILDMMMHVNIAEVNGCAIDEANQVSFILESLPKSFIPFQMNASLNKIEFNLTTLLNELQRFQNLTKTEKLPKIPCSEKSRERSTRKLVLGKGFLRARSLSRYGHVYLIQNKSDSFEKFKEYKAEVENESEPRRSGRVVQQPDRLLSLSEAQIIIPDDGIEDPLTFKQAMNDVYSDQWIKAMDLEMESMYSNSVWTLVDQPNDVRPIGCKWIYKRKRDQAGKDRLLKLDLWQKMDVKTVFLNGNLEESIYMVQPERYKMQNSKKDLMSYKSGIHLSKEQCSKTPQEVEDMNNIPYASAFRSVIRIKDYMLVYGSNDMILTGYTDSDFQTDKDAKKSTSGSVFTLNGGAVVWRSIKQSCIADSTMEAENVAACEERKK
ncbi:gag/pol protein [Cucumis melo var. makuwa]|uniref:Gag/pol protein n=1 Tax=Cucumis melo var. makuwa TaxID=1194695 RepID=A0A5D3C0V0_CUCMM|nr:gag/pol protein [Cucumis melo var. makuwa]TYK04802.1 gag/pol protein [Cucumis melo var. makuwa]